MNLLLAILAALAACLLLGLGALLVLVSGSGLVVEAYSISLLLAAGIALWRWRRGTARARAAGSLRARQAMVSVCVVLAVGFGAALVANWVAMRPPRQAEVAAWLRENRTRFEQLRGMLEEDRLRGALDYGREYSRDSLRYEPPDRAGLSSLRSAEYQRLMRAAGCQRVDVWPDGSINFAFRGRGIAGHGWRVSVAWSRDEPSPLLPTIDGFPATRPPGADRIFSRLDGSWYAHVVW